jgi:hypothetical protein
MLKMVCSPRPGMWVAVIRACFMAYMQQTEEQYPLALRLVLREPTHWIQAIFSGGLPSESFSRCPWVGPPGESMRSYSRLVTTSAIFRIRKNQGPRDQRAHGPGKE